MTDTQVMAALEPTQADREAAADVLFHVDGDPFVEHIREGLEDDSYLVQAFARHRIASSPAATLPDCIVNGDVEAWLFSHPDRDGDMEAGRLELFNFRMGYAAPVTPPAVDADEAYEIGKRDGYEAAIADVDRRTGGDGEYFASTIPGRGCPDWQTMMANIVERFESAAHVAVDAEVRKWPPSEADWNAGLADIVEALWSASTANYIRAGKLRTEDIKAKYALRDVILRLAPSLATPPSVPAQQEEGWQGIATAPRDGSYILAIVAPNRGRHLEHQAGRVFVIRHEGKTVSDYDLGWAVYPGFGGASDYDFTYWMPLPATPPSQDQKGVEG